MTYTRITALWNGATGLPGYTRLKFAGYMDSAAAGAAAGRIRTFFDAIKAYIPAGVVISFSDVAQEYNDAGTLTGEVSYTAPANVNCLGSGSYSAASGAVVQWLTGLFVGGRRARGRTYLVPLVGTAFDTNGTLSSAFSSAATSAAGALLAGTPDLVVHGGKPPSGTWTASVTGAFVPDRGAMLRSRRD